MIQNEEKPQKTVISRQDTLPDKMPTIPLMERTQAIKTASEARFNRYAPSDVKIQLQNCLQNLSDVKPM